MDPCPSLLALMVTFSHSFSFTSGFKWPCLRKLAVQNKMDSQYMAIPFHQLKTKIDPQSPSLPRGSDSFHCFRAHPKNGGLRTVGGETRESVLHTWGFHIHTYGGGAYLLFSCSIVSHSLRPHWLWATRLLCPRDFPGKNTQRHSELGREGRVSWVTIRVPMAPN